MPSLPPSLLDLIAASTGRAPRMQTRRALVTASHELEDRYGVQRGVTPLLFGGFQRMRFFDHDRARWRHFARGAAMTVVAVGADGPPRSEPGDPVILHVGRDDPFWRDWLCLAYAGPEGSGVLIARDVEGDPDEPLSERRSVGLVSHDPRVAHAAAVWTGAYLAGHDPALGARWRAALDAAPPLPRRRARRRAAGAIGS